MTNWLYLWKVIADKIAENRKKEEERRREEIAKKYDAIRNKWGWWKWGVSEKK